MSVQLVLIPDFWPPDDTPGILATEQLEARFGFFADDSLGVGLRCQEMFDELESCAKPFSGVFHIRCGGGTATETPVRKPITYIEARKLDAIMQRHFSKHHEIVRQYDWAVLAFVKSLPPDRRVFLWWS